MTVDSEPSGEDVLELGARRRAVHRHHTVHRYAARWPYALAVVALGAGILTVTGTGRGSDQAQPAPTRSSSPAPTVTVAPDDSALHAVPATDMRRVLASITCRDGCIARFPPEGTVRGFTESFASLRTVAAGLVTGPIDRVVFLTAEGRAEPDSLVHLTAERKGRQDAAVRVRYQPLDGSQTASVSATRGGWVLRVDLVARGTALPVLAATRWAETVVLPR
ncbi:MAG: hypothetical protein ABI345_10155 [Jatrophihabitans sp.]